MLTMMLIVGDFYMFGDIIPVKMGHISCLKMELLSSRKHITLQVKSELDYRTTVLISGRQRKV